MKLGFAEQEVLRKALVEFTPTVSSASGGAKQNGGGNSTIQFSLLTVA